MTIIITASNRYYSLAALDRRVTTQAGSVHNNNANKGICLRLRDGVFTVSFTGNAQVQDLPTDDWLAGVIMGKSWGRDTSFGELASFSFGGSGCPEYLGGVLRRIHIALSNKAQNNFLFRQYPLEICISGLRSKHNRLFPYLLIVRKGFRTSEISYELLDRAERRNHSFFKLYISGGYGEKHADIRRMLITKLKSTVDLSSTSTINKLIGTLHYAVQLFAQREISIGSDVLRIAHLPLVNYSKIEFVPSMLQGFASPFLYGAERTKQLSYNPWIISPGTCFSPQGMVGEGVIVHANGHEFELAGVKSDEGRGTKLAILPLVRK